MYRSRVSSYTLCVIGRSLNRTTLLIITAFDVCIAVYTMYLHFYSLITHVFIMPY